MISHAFLVIALLFQVPPVVMLRPLFVYFDLGNVLVYFDHSVALSKLSAITGQPPEFLRSVVFDQGLEDRYETGMMTSHQFAAAINTACQTSCTVNSILEAVSDIFWPNESILPILAKLKENGIRLGLLSNTNDAHWQWIMKQNYAMLRDWFDPIVLSFEIHAMKPQNEVYRHATRVAGVAADRIFFTDDRIENVEGASRAGWHTHLFRDVPSLDSELNRILELPVSHS